MAWTQKRRDTLAADLDLFLGALCTEWGFCTWLTGAELLAASDPISGDEFARAVLHADGFPPDELTWYLEIKAKFAERYDSNAISAVDYAKSFELRISR